MKLRIILGCQKKSFLFPAGEGQRFAAGESGFTLIELVMVIVISAVLAAVAIPRLQSFGTIKLYSTAQRVRADVRYVQQLAISRHDTYSVSFNVSANSYEVRRVADNQLAVHPATRSVFAVKLDSDVQASGVKIISSDFGGTPALRFDWRGSPSNANNVTLSQAGSVRFAYGSDDVDIVVQPNTGMVSVQ